MNAILEQLNSMGGAFVEFAGPMLVQSSVLIAILLIGDFVLRRKVRAVFRYWLWMLVLVKLVLPTSLTTPVSLGYLFGDELQYVQTDYMPAAVSEAPVPQLAEAEPAEAGSVEISGEVLIPPPATTEAGPAAAESGAQPVVAMTPVTWEGVLFLAWLAGVIALGLLLAQRAIFVVGLVAQAKGVNGLMGFSNLNIEACRFEGFEYVICYGEGTEGTMSDSLIMDCGHQGVILYSGATVKIIRNVITGSKYYAVRSTGGTLDVRDNLIIENANRGIYLGNKSARGVISNNIIMGSGTGISGFARSRVRIQNNIIADSSYAGISMRDSCSLSIRNNILQGNAKGCILYKGGSKNANKVFRNLF